MNIKPATMLEQTVSILVIVTLLGVGFFSEPWFELTEQSMQKLSTLFVTKGMH